MMEEFEIRRPSPAMGFAILIGLLGVGLFVGSLAGGAVWYGMTGRSLFNLEQDIQNPQYANAARIMQMVSVFFMFFIPSLLVARYMNRAPFRWLGYREGFSAKQLVLVFVIMAVSLPMVSVLGELNQAIPLPKRMVDIVNKMEDNYNTQAQAMATMRSFGEYVFAMVVMALFPAVFEETFFRGGMQQVLNAWFEKPLAAIIVTSILFSAMHISWYGFLPRFALGMVLGLLFHYSRSIWLNIIAHFLHNGLAVTYMYWLTVHNKPIKDVTEENTPIWWGIPAILAVIMLVRYFQLVSARRQFDKIPPMDGPSIESNLA